jgi:glycine/D-amino acid oxidase-like deaminating enzyme
VRRIEADGDAVTVTTDVDAYRAATVVVTAGGWVADLLAGVVELPPLNVTREQVFHFTSRLSPDHVWPSYIHHGDVFVYGLQAPGDEGVKVAEHHTGAVTTADTRSFEIDEIGRQRVVRHVTRLMPGLDPTPTSSATCLYTTTADESFVIERRGSIVVGSPCSGHGFKFTPLIGRRLAELALGRGPG